MENRATIVIMAFALIVFAPAAVSQERTADQRLHIIAAGLGLGANVTADSIEREAPTLKWNPSVIHLRGNVEIRRRIALSLPARGQKQSSMYLIVRADEADYHEDTGEIAPRGSVRVSFQPIQ